MMSIIKTLMIFLLLGFADLSWCQVDHVDRLITEAKEQPLGDNGRRANQLPYWLQAFNESQKIDGEYRLDEIATTIGDIFSDDALYEQALSYYKIVLPDLSSDIKTAEDIALVRKIGQTFSGLGLPDSAYFYCSYVFDEFSYPERIDVLRDIVDIYISNDKFESALEYNLTIDKLLKENNASDSELAKVNNNLGYNYNFLGQHDKAIDYFNRASDLNRDKTGDEEISVLINMGIAHFNAGEYERSIASFKEASTLDELPARNGEIDQLLATAFYKNNDHFSALKYLGLAEKKCKSTSNAHLLSDVYYTYAQIYAGLLEYDNALSFYQKHFDIRDSLDLIRIKQQQELLQHQRQLENTEKEVEIDLKTKALLISQLETDNAEKSLELSRINLENTNKENELVRLRQDKEIKEAAIENQELERIQTEQNLRLAQQQLAAVRAEREILDLKQQEQEQRAISAEQSLQIERKEAELSAEKNATDLLKKDNAIGQLEIDRRKSSQRNLALGAGLLSALLLALYFIYRNKNKAHGKLTLAYDDLNEAQVQLKHAEKRITGLLKQQVSGAVAHALMTNTDQKKVERRFVCIMFLDIRNFTGFAESRKPEEIIAFQNSVFGFMINIIEKRHGVVNQLLGDGFMATFGAPLSTGNDSHNAYLASREIISTLQDKVSSGDVIPTKIGIGLHSGFVVTGNVGNEERKQYSITGNTVILAARLEQLNKEYGSSLVLSKEVYDQLPPDNRDAMDFKEVMVKGRSKPIAVASIS